MSSKPMRRTDAIIKDLQERISQGIESGAPVDVRAINQEIVAHQELARLRAKRAERVEEKDWLAVNDLDAQIQHWIRFVSEDVDPKVAEDPRKNETTLVEPVPPTTAAVATPPLAPQSKN